MAKRTRNQTEEVRNIPDEDLEILYNTHKSVKNIGIFLSITSSYALKLLASRLRNLGILKSKITNVSTGKNNKRYKKANYYLVDNGPFINTVVLKEKLILEEILENKCFECGMPPFWKGKPLVIELHHIDGNRKNNQLNNLQLLCPNCHSQTDNYKSKNTNKV